MKQTQKGVRRKRSGVVVDNPLPKGFFANWFIQNGRNFPWRRNGVSPFGILITEMLLRQTAARGVAKLWEDFIATYPDPHAIIKTRRRTLMNRLKILGFGNQRAEALQHAAKYLIDHHDGQVPRAVDDLLRVPHIGNYAARAVSCFAFGKRVEIVDTNILRFFARYYGLTVKADIRRNPQIWEIAKKAMPRDKCKAKMHNYGLLDFTGEICRALHPRCIICPLNKSCVWGRALLTSR